MHKHLKSLLTAIVVLILAAFAVTPIAIAVAAPQESDCPSPGSDEWRSYAHDNRQTSASSISVGNPNQVTLEWTTSFAALSNFTNPTIANGIVYQSSDNRLNAIDLTDGSLEGIVAGAPEMASDGNRGNTTVAFARNLPSGPNRDVVFVTGGSFPSLSCWNLLLESPSPLPIWQRSPGHPFVPGLHSQARFGAAKVVDVGGTDVVFVQTEPPTGSGRIWAIVAGTGALYPGWALNPLILDVGAKHGPAVHNGKLYLGTAVGGTNRDGSLYQIDAATGVIDWNYVGVPGEGWPSGVSVEGDFVYGATRDAANIGRRYKIDKSGAGPVVVWTAEQGTGLYATPTIGRNYVYFPLDNPSHGLLQVDKTTGAVIRNFAEGDICGTQLFMVPQIATLSCDSYLFAGDRRGRWWLFNAVSGAPEWYRQFPFITGGEIVNGTALASHNSVDYAVVSIRQLNGLGGQLSAYRLNAGPRPRLVMCQTEDTVQVPLNSGSGIPHTTAGDVFQSIGELPVNFSALTITDPPPNGQMASVSSLKDYKVRVEGVARDFDGYTAIASHANLSKKHIIAGLGDDMEDGFTAREMALIDQRTEMLKQRRANDNRASASAAAAVRTSAVQIGGASVPTALGPGASANLSWLYDGTGLGRGTDANRLDFEMDDPDFSYDGSPLAAFHILYIGGCPRMEDTLHFGPGNSEHVFNYGALGYGFRSDAWYFANDPVNPESNLFDAGVFLFGDSTSGIDGGAQIRMQIYNQTATHYAPNASPSGGVCGFDVQRNVLLGAKRVGGCPGTPSDIYGEIITHSMSDTDFTAVPGSRMAAIGLNIIQTEVGAYDPLYGDFKLIEWDVVNRDASAKGPIYIGTWADWDAGPNAATNVGNYSADANGYYIWDQAAAGARNAYGSLDPAHRATYSGISPIEPAHRIVIHSFASRVYSGGPWPNQNTQAVWSQAINETPSFLVDPGGPQDRAGLLINAAMHFGPHESVRRYQCFFGVDASSNNDPVIEANVKDLAKRAARWAGFARGDVNDDGYVDLADVCWLQNGNNIYPAAYSGDVDNNGTVDAADVARLLSYVSGSISDQPEGTWRF